MRNGTIPDLESAMAANIFMPCLLCGERPVAVVGVFIPNDKLLDRAGIPKGKAAAFPYSLCRACNELPENMRNAAVENKCIPQLMTGAN